MKAEEPRGTLSLWNHIRVIHQGSAGPSGLPWKLLQHFRMVGIQEQGVDLECSADLMQQDMGGINKWGLYCIAYMPESRFSL